MSKVVVLECHGLFLPVLRLRRLCDIADLSQFLVVSQHLINMRVELLNVLLKARQVEEELLTVFALVLIPINLHHRIRGWLTFSSWTCWCCLRFEPEVKALSHIVHLYGRSPVCILRWRIRLELYTKVRAMTTWVKAFPQCANSQMYGFSPVWTRKCFFNDGLCVNTFPHNSLSRLYLISLPPPGFL